MGWHQKTASAGECRATEKRKNRKRKPAENWTADFHRIPQFFQRRVIYAPFRGNRQGVFSAEIILPIGVQRFARAAGVTGPGDYSHQSRIVLFVQAVT